MALLKKEGRRNPFQGRPTLKSNPRRNGHPGKELVERMGSKNPVNLTLNLPNYLLS